MHSYWTRPRSCTTIGRSRSYVSVIDNLFVAWSADFGGLVLGGPGGAPADLRSGESPLLPKVHHQIPLRRHCSLPVIQQETHHTIPTELIRKAKQRCTPIQPWPGCRHRGRRTAIVVSWPRGAVTGGCRYVPGARRRIHLAYMRKRKRLAVLASSRMSDYPLTWSRSPRSEVLLAPPSSHRD